ncbi:uncharacterized protein K452DRAFT_349142 [Aplosporella prunicola CBS 121167]|uniref:Protein kinase domain-containing protein n=1 Tax=Aplosporella prunicola CBS 121167 TaxID=1176127 RepID=A0A6A6BNG3_9PEZI|nr:uncharacterized protein K452DRAFT_349142 [Aplosporella prunicola CBS 121167]KAF2145670.1 hypothetical protein K452DRAFT_349142 [Aplosporella prunicola CBS 121167]
MSMFSSALKSFTSNISSNYSIASQPSSYSGPWKIYDAKKKSTGKPASVFVFDKKNLEPQGSGGLGMGGRAAAGSLKRVHEEVLERLKKEASSLARLRHPSILELAEPVEETRNGGLMFATEPVTASLGSLLRDKDDQERSGGPGGRASRHVVDDAGSRRRREVEIDELEIQKGLLQVAKGLEFLHESAGLVHCNLTPEAVFVNAKSDWKISGLAFCSPPENSNKPTSVAPISLSELLNHDPRLPRSVQMNLDYTSPDFVLDNNISVAADIFSLGLLIIALYNSPHRSPLESNQSLSTYKRIFASSASVPTQSNNFLLSSPLPRQLQYELLPRLITRRPAQRLNAREFQQAGYFDNILVSTIRFLDTLPAKTPNEKTQFMRGLPRILNQFPKSVLEKKVLPALLEEMKDKELLALVLQNIFKIIGLMPAGRRAFCEKVIPRLREIILSGGGVKGERDSAKEAGLMVLLENTQLMADSTNGKEFKDDILPIIHIALESPTHSLVDAGLRTLPIILYVLDFSTIKNELFPIISSVFAKTTSMGIKVRGLQAFQVLCGGTPPGQDGADGLDGINGDAKKRKQNPAVLDKYTIQEKIVPLLKAIKTKEPAVMMASLDVLKEVGKIADSDFLATDVLPLLWQFSLGPLLNLPQFQSFMQLIKQLSTRIETEHTRKLQELGAPANASATAAPGDMFLSFGGAGANGTLSPTGGGGEEDFEALVLGKPRGVDAAPAFDGGWAASGTAAAPQASSSSRPPNPRTQSAVQFSWSTPSPPAQGQAYAPPPPPPPQTSAPAPRPTSLAFPTLAPSGPSRTITPDQSMASFGVLQPQRTGPQQQQQQQSAFSLPLQPARANSSGAGMGMGMGTGMGAAGASAGGIDWSAASRAVNTQNAMQVLNQNRSMVSSPPAGQQQQSQGVAGMYSAFSIAPPPAGGVGAGRGAGAGAGSGGMGGMGMGMGMGQQGQKKGLDQWESLI